MRNRTLLALALAAAACDAPDRTTAPNATPAAPNHDFGVLPSGPAGIIGYMLVDISGGVTSGATDVNDSGYVVGSHTVGGATHGFVRHPDGTVEDIAPLRGYVSTVATGINGANRVVGTSTASNGNTQAWYRDPGQPASLLFGGFCSGQVRANAIDDAGEIVGTCAGTPVVWLATAQNTWSPTEVQGDLLDVAAHTPVGTINVSATTTAAVAWGPHGMTKLAMPAGTTQSRVTGVNASRTMVGAYTVGGVERGFWATLTATFALAHPVYGVSDAGRMVGWYATLPAVAYTIAPRATAETPLPPTSLSRVAVRVNTCGTIVGHYFPNGLFGGARAAMWIKSKCD